MLQLGGGRHVRRNRGDPMVTCRSRTAAARVASAALRHRQRLAATAAQRRTQVVGDFRLDEQLFEDLGGNGF